MLCTAVSMALCGMTPLQAADNENLEQAVSKGVAAQTLKSKESDRFAEKTLYDLIKAHDGNVEKAVEEFAGEKFPEQYNNTAVYVAAVYADPQQENKLFVDLVHALAWVDGKGVRFFYTFTSLPAVRGEGYQEPQYKGGYGGKYKVGDHEDTYAYAYPQGTFQMPWEYENAFLAMRQKRAGQIQLYTVTQQHARETIEALKKRVIDWNNHWPSSVPGNSKTVTQTADAQTVIEELIKAHNGNVEKAVEEFAGKSFLNNGLYKDARVHAVYVSPDDPDKIWIVYTVQVSDPSNPDSKSYYTPYLFLARIKQGEKDYHYVSSYSLKGKIPVFENFEIQGNGFFSNWRRYSIESWQSESCPSINVASLIGGDVDTDYTSQELRKLLNEYAQCEEPRGHHVYRVYVDVKNSQHLYVIDGNDSQVRLTDYWVGNTAKGGRHTYVEFPESANDTGWQERAVTKLSSVALHDGNWLLWKNRNIK